MDRNRLRPLVAPSSSTRPHPTRGRARSRLSGTRPRSFPLRPRSLQRPRRICRPRSRRCRPQGFRRPRRRRWARAPPCNRRCRSARMRSLRRLSLTCSAMPRILPKTLRRPRRRRLPVRRTSGVCTFAFSSWRPLPRIGLGSIVGMPRGPSAVWANRLA